MADEQTSTPDKGRTTISVEAHYIFVPKLGGAVFVVKPGRENVGGRLEYEMAVGTGRKVSFVRNLLHIDGFDSLNYTYFGDGVVSNWDWSKSYSRKNRTIF